MVDDDHEDDDDDDRFYSLRTSLELVFACQPTSFGIHTTQKFTQNILSVYVSEVMSMKHLSSSNLEFGYSVLLYGFVFLRFSLK